MPKTAVVILNYNGQKYLEQFLPTLIELTPEAEIIVADNQSTDNSIEFLQSIGGIRIIELERNYGYAGGYNQALQQIDADYYVLVNSDIEVTTGWLEPLISTLDKNTGYAAAQPKIKSYHDKKSFEYAGAAGGFIDQLGFPYCRGRIFDSVEEDHHQYDDECDIFWASGACFIIRADVFHDHSGFDETFFAHMEEIDLCWRIQSDKGRIRYTPKSTVYHIGGGTLNTSNPKKTYLNFRNGLSILIKNLPLGRLVWVLPIRVVLDIIAGLKFWVDNKDHRHFAAVISAHIDSILKICKTFKKRGFTSSQGTLFSIVWEYFLKGKKKFSDL